MKNLTINEQKRQLVARMDADRLRIQMGSAPLPEPAPARKGRGGPEFWLRTTLVGLLAAGGGPRFLKTPARALLSIWLRERISASLHGDHPTTLPTTRNEHMESTTTPGFNQSPSTGFSSRSDRTSDARQGRGSQRWLDKFDTILNESSDQDIETLKARLREQLATARGALNDAAGTAAGAANSYVRDAIECTEQYVETRPWQAISYVAGAAFLLGIIVGRR